MLHKNKSQSPVDTKGAVNVIQTCSDLFALYHSYVCHPVLPLSSVGLTAPLPTLRYQTRPLSAQSLTLTELLS